MGEKTQAGTRTEFLPFPYCCHRKKMLMKAKTVVGVGAAGRQTVGRQKSDLSLVARLESDQGRYGATKVGHGGG